MMFSRNFVGISWLRASASPFTGAAPSDAASATAAHTAYSALAEMFTRAGPSARRAGRVGHAGRAEPNEDDLGLRGEPPAPAARPGEQGLHRTQSPRPGQR